MKSYFLLLFACLAPLGQLAAQVFAIVTVDYTNVGSNSLRQFVIQLNENHAPRSVAAFMLLGEPKQTFYRNSNLTTTVNPAGQYSLTNEEGTLFTNTFAYTIIAENLGPSPSTAILIQGTSVLANLSRDSNTNLWSSSNPAFSISYNSETLRYMVEATAELPHFDGTDNFYRNGAISATNPTGDYSPSLAGGGELPGEAAYTILAITNNFFQITGATLTRKGSDTVEATFTPQGLSWISDNPGYSLSVFDSRFILKEDVAIIPTLTTEPLYTPDDFLLIGGDHPHLSLGRAGAAPNQANGFIFQDEIVDVGFATFQNDSLWGNRFATNAGLVGNQQRYAVAFANSSTQLPASAGGEVLITGFNGNPDFDGRHTHVGTVFGSTYFRLSGGTVPGSRIIVDQLLAGEPATFVSIEFENQSTSFDPITFTNPILQDIRLPGVSLSGRSAPSLDFSNSRRQVLSGASPGDFRRLERSSDLLSWTAIGTAGSPLAASSPYGLDIDRPSRLDVLTGIRHSILEDNPRSFFRTTLTAINFPQWPAAQFEDNLPNANLSFRGRVVDGDNPQVLNVYNIFLDSTGQAGILDGIGGDLAGTHILSSISYFQTGPFTGELELVSDTLPELLRLRLYFDSHKGGELTGGRNPIERFHRLTIQELNIAGNNFFQEQVSEFGIWISNN